MKVYERKKARWRINILDLETREARTISFIPDKRSDKINNVDVLKKFVIAMHDLMAEDDECFNKLVDKLKEMEKKEKELNKAK